MSAWDYLSTGEAERLEPCVIEPYPIEDGRPVVAYTEGGRPILGPPNAARLASWGNELRVPS